MRIVTDPEISFVKPFEYEKAVVTELRWLLNNDIINGISEEELTRIEGSLRVRAQYWTLQDTVLDYNAFFEYQKIVHR
jgi:hypothetical protein